VTALLLALGFACTRRAEANARQHTLALAGAPAKKLRRTVRVCYLRWKSSASCFIYP